MIQSTAAVLSKNICWAWNLPRVLDDDRVELLASAVLELLRELGCLTPRCDAAAESIRANLTAKAGWIQNESAASEAALE